MNLYSIGSVNELLALGFIPFFIGLWCVVCLILSFAGGWRKLSKIYPAVDPPSGWKHGMASAKVGVVNYNNCLTIYANNTGVYFSVWAIFRLGHKPFLIPWTELHNPQAKQFLWIKYVTIDVGCPRIVKLTLTKKIYDSLMQQQAKF